MEFYHLEVIDGHMIWTLNGKRTLIDTGSPWSFGKSIRLYNREISLPESIAGLDVGTVSKYSGIEIDTVLGCDVLKEMAMRIDVNNNELAVAPTGAAVTGTRLPLNTNQHIPVVNLYIKGEKHLAFLDTGAKVSYAPGSILYEYPCIGHCQDYYPMFGVFHTDVYEIPVCLGDREILVRCGRLPDLLQMSLKLFGGAPCILGYDLFRQSRVFIDIGKSVMGIEFED